MTWSRAVQVSAANNNASQRFRETGHMTVASNGTVEDFWTENADATHKQSLQVVATSTDGGLSFTAPITVSPVTDYPLTGTPFDVVDLFNRVPGMSARVDCFPHPAADPASNRVVVVWCDLGTVAAVDGRNVFFPEPAIGGDGVISVGFDAPRRRRPTTRGRPACRPMTCSACSRVAHASRRPLLVSTASSNPDSSSYNNLREQFVGDYIGAVSGPTSTWLAWTDSRNAGACSAGDAYRTAVYGGSKTAVAPNPDSSCSTNFGNTDTRVAEIGH